jgi:F-type H+-transporting ATPase subunit c
MKGSIFSDLNAIRLIVVGLICMVASWAAAISDSKVVATALESIARQPEMENRLFMVMLLGIGLLESIPIIAIVIAFMILGGVK